MRSGLFFKGLAIILLSGSFSLATTNTSTTNFPSHLVHGGPAGEHNSCAWFFQTLDQLVGLIPNTVGQDSELAIQLLEKLESDKHCINNGDLQKTAVDEQAEAIIDQVGPLVLNQVLENQSTSSLAIRLAKLVKGHGYSVDSMLTKEELLNRDWKLVSGEELLDLMLTCEDVGAILAPTVGSNLLEKVTHTLKDKEQLKEKKTLIIEIVQYATPQQLDRVIEKTIDFVALKSLLGHITTLPLARLLVKRYSKELMAWFEMLEEQMAGFSFQELTKEILNNSLQFKLLEIAIDLELDIQIAKLPYLTRLGSVLGLLDAKETRIVESQYWMDLLLLKTKHIEFAHGNIDVHFELRAPTDIFNNSNSSDDDDELDRVSDEDSSSSLNIKSKRNYVRLAESKAYPLGEIGCVDQNEAGLIDKIIMKQEPNKKSNKPDKNPNNKPKQNPSSKPNKKPKDRPIKKPTDKPTKRPNDKPIKKPNKPIKKPNNKPSKKPTRNQSSSNEPIPFHGPPVIGPFSLSFNRYQWKASNNIGNIINHLISRNNPNNPGRNVNCWLDRVVVGPLNIARDRNGTLTRAYWDVCLPQWAKQFSTNRILPPNFVSTFIDFLTRQRLWEGIHEPTNQFLNARNFFKLIAHLTEINSHRVHQALARLLQSLVSIVHSDNPVLFNLLVRAILRETDLHTPKTIDLLYIWERGIVRPVDSLRLSSKAVYAMCGFVDRAFKDRESKKLWLRKFLCQWFRLPLKAFLESTGGYTGPNSVSFFQFWYRVLRNKRDELDLGQSEMFLEALVDELEEISDCIFISYRRHVAWLFAAILNRKIDTVCTKLETLFKRFMLPTTARAGYPTRNRMAPYLYLSKALVGTTELYSPDGLELLVERGSELASELGQSEHREKVLHNLRGLEERIFAGLDEWNQRYGEENKKISDQYWEGLSVISRLKRVIDNVERPHDEL